MFEKFGSGWLFVLDYDIADAMPGARQSFWENMRGTFPAEAVRQAELFQERQTNKKRVFSRATSWLESLTDKPNRPVLEAEWEALAESVFWMARFEIDWPFEEWLLEGDLDSAVASLPIDILGDLVLAISESDISQFRHWLEVRRPSLVTRFQKETRTVALEDDGRKVTSHFIVQIEELSDDQVALRQYSGSKTNRLHSEAVRRIGLLRRLFPDREAYACQGYGHRLWSRDLPVDDTYKSGILRSNYPIQWLTSVNATYRGRVELIFRPSTWSEYADQVIRLRQVTLQTLRQLNQAVEVHFRKQKSVRLLGGLVNVELYERCRSAFRNSPLLPRCSVDEWGFVDESMSSAPVHQTGSPLLLEKYGLNIQQYRPFLTPFHEYVRGLSNYLDQAIHALVLSPSISKGVTSEAQLAKIKEVLGQQGIEPRLANLSNSNLHDAVTVLRRTQYQFRCLFGQFLASGELASLERQEVQLFDTLWIVWYFFISSPKRVMQSASKECPEHAAHLLSRMRQNIRRELRGLRAGGLRIVIVSEGVLWDEEPALWITVDGINPTDVYTSSGQVIDAIRRGIEQEQSTELRRYVLDFNWKHVVIVPQVRGKSLDGTGWRIHMSTILSQRLHWWNFFRHPISPDTLTQLNISTWSLPRLSMATALMQSSQELALLTGHIRDFRMIPEMNDEGMAFLQNYVHDVSREISRAFQSLTRSYGEMAKFFTELNPSERDRHPNLVAATLILSKSLERVMLTLDDNGETQLELGELCKWADRLEQVQGEVVVACLLWAADVLDEVTVQKF